MNKNASYILSAGNRVLVFAPHPDDESLGCGGTIALCTEMGKEVGVVVISKGEAVNVRADDIVEVRKKEASRAAEILQIRQLVFMDFPDGALATRYAEVKQGMRNVIQTFHPDIVFAPSPLDSHEDHVVVSRITMDLLREIGSFNVAFYEIYSPIRYNCIVDITEVMDKKEKAVMCYHYSLLEQPGNMFYAVEGLNAYRSFDFLKKGFWEAFYVITAADSEDAIAEWLTHGLSKEASSYAFLSRLKKADELLTAYQQSLQRIEELTGSLQERERQVEHLEREYAALADSAAGKVVLSLYKIRDTVLPWNTKRRMLYNAIVGKLKPKGKYRT
jgi:LmbE family N-acetylglucosaminyl deacetylase